MISHLAPSTELPAVGFLAGLSPELSQRIRSMNDKLTSFEGRRDAVQRCPSSRARTFSTNPFPAR